MKFLKKFVLNIVLHIANRVNYENPTVNIILKIFLRKFLEKRTFHVACFPRDYIGREIIVDEIYEKQNLKNLEKYILPSLNDKKIFLDIGANIGVYSIYLAKYFTSIYSFEPNPIPFKLLEASLLYNNLINVNPLNFGLGERSDKLPFYFDSANIGGSSFQKLSVHKERHIRELSLEIKRYDELTFIEHNDVSFIKIDVEGFEADVLRGMKNFLENNSPVILMEFLFLKDESKNELFEIYWFLKECKFDFIYNLENDHKFSINSGQRIINHIPANLFFSKYPLSAASGFKISVSDSSN